MLVAVKLVLWCNAVYPSQISSQCNRERYGSSSLSHLRGCALTGCQGKTKDTVDAVAVPMPFYRVVLSLNNQHFSCFYYNNLNNPESVTPIAFWLVYL